MPQLIQKTWKSATFDPELFVRKYMEKRLWLKGFPQNRQMHPLAAFVVLHKHNEEQESIMFAYAYALDDFKKAWDATPLVATDISTTYTALQEIQNELGRRERAITYVMALLLSQTTQSGGTYANVEERVKKLLADIGVNYTAIKSEITEMFRKMSPTSKDKEFYKPWKRQFKLTEVKTGGSTTKFFDQNAQTVENPLDTVYFDL